MSGDYLSTIPADAPSSPAPWLEGLNPVQRQAVEHLDGALLVLSGAGTGKTRVLTCRLANLIASGRARPWNILAVTFTNKAANEIKTRVEAMIGSVAEQAWFGTFHSLAARILRRHAECVGLTSNFTILDADDQLRLLKRVMAEEGLDIKQHQPRFALWMIERWKDRGLSPDKVGSAEAQLIANGAGAHIYAQYQQRLLALNACDFGDLLLHNLTIFTAHPEILAEYHERITHIMVDEYQDTNVAQYLWLSLLARASRNLCCVGDDDQSIYGWRGAEVENMLRFAEIYPEAKTIRLEENYRSTSHILGVASSLIAHNEKRLGKTLFTSKDSGDKVRVSGYWDGRREAMATAMRIEKLHRQGGVSFDRMAVLVRAGYQTREFEEAFVNQKIPYRVVGAKFYERREIRDAIAYLRLLVQPADDLAFERIINTPKRGLGDVALGTIRAAAREQGLPLLAAAEHLLARGGLKPAVSKNLGGFVDLFVRWRKLKAEMTHGNLMMQMLEDSGYVAMWRQDKSIEAEGRVENLKELITAMARFEGLDEFLEHIALVMDGDNVSEEGDVMLMTLHAAKGLEFDVLFLPCWEEGAFPSPRTLDEGGNAGLEEERRLAYVGVTRARQLLHISYAASRQVHGLWQNGAPSRFIAELPAEHIEEEAEQGMARISRRGARAGVSWSSSGGGGAKGSGGGGGWAQASAPVPDAFMEGERVFHQKFGNGNIIAIEGDKLTVAFDKAGEKKLISRFVTRTSNDGE